MLTRNIFRSLAKPGAYRRAQPALIALGVRSSASAATEEKHILQELKDGVLYLTLNRPKSFNAMTIDMGVEMQNIVASLQDPVKCAEAKVRAVVFTGAGKAFSSGGDLKFLLARSEDNPEHNSYEMVKFYKRFLSIRNLPVPTVAAINGPAVGAGACFALACDIRVMAEGASLGLTFSKLSLHPGMGATHYLPRLVGPQTANKMLLTGEMLDASTAKALGVVAEVAEVGKALEAASKIAGELAANHNVGQATLLKTLRLQQDRELDNNLQREADAQAICYKDPVFRQKVLDMVNKAKK